MKSALPSKIGTENELGISVGLEVRSGMPSEWPNLHDYEPILFDEVLERIHSKVLAFGGVAYDDYGNVEISGAVCNSPREALAHQIGHRLVSQDVLSDLSKEHSTWLRLDWRSNDSFGRTWGMHTNYSFDDENRPSKLEVNGWTNILSKVGQTVFGPGTYYEDHEKWYFGQKTIQALSGTSRMRNTMYDYKSPRTEIRFHTPTLSPWAGAMQLGLTAMALALDKQQVAPPFGDYYPDRAIDRIEVLRTFSNEAFMLLGSDPRFEIQGYLDLLKELDEFLDDYDKNEFRMLSDRNDLAAKIQYSKSAKLAVLGEQRQAYADFRYSSILFDPEGKSHPGLGVKAAQRDRFRSVKGFAMSEDECRRMMQTPPDGVAKLFSEVGSRLNPNPGQVSFRRITLPYINRVDIESAVLMYEQNPSYLMKLLDKDTPENEKVEIALQLTEAIADEGVKSLIQYNICVAIAHKSSLVAAQDFAQELTDDKTKGKSLNFIVNELIKHGNVILARKIAKTISHDGWRRKALSSLRKQK